LARYFKQRAGTAFNPAHSSVKRGPFCPNELGRQPSEVRVFGDNPASACRRVRTLMESYPKCPGSGWILKTDRVMKNGLISR